MQLGLAEALWARWTDRRAQNPDRLCAQTTLAGAYMSPSDLKRVTMCSVLHVVWVNGNN